VSWAPSLGGDQAGVVCRFEKVRKALGLGEATETRVQPAGRGTWYKGRRNAGCGCGYAIYQYVCVRE